MNDFEDAFSQIMSHPAKPEKMSEDREPMREELNKKMETGVLNPGPMQILLHKSLKIYPDSPKNFGQEH